MEKQDFISIHILSSHYNVPVSFIILLHELELIKIISIQKKLCVYKTQIKDVEKIMRLHFDLNINLEGIHAVSNLLKQVETLQNEIRALNNKLSRFEY